MSEPNRTIGVRLGLITERSIRYAGIEAERILFSKGTEAGSRLTDHDHNVTGVTFVDDSEVAVVAVCEMTDLPVQEDECDTDSERDREDDTPPDITVTRSGRAIRAHFRLDLYKEHHQDDQVCTHP